MSMLHFMWLIFLKVFGPHIQDKNNLENFNVETLDFSQHICDVPTVSFNLSSSFHHILHIYLDNKSLAVTLSPMFP